MAPNYTRASTLIYYAQPPAHRTGLSRRPGKAVNRVSWVGGTSGCDVEVSDQRLGSDIIKSFAVRRRQKGEGRSIPRVYKMKSNTLLSGRRQVTLLLCGTCLESVVCIPTGNREDRRDKKTYRGVGTTLGPQRSTNNSTAFVAVDVGSDRSTRLQKQNVWPLTRQAKSSIFLKYEPFPHLLRPPYRRR